MQFKDHEYDYDFSSTGTSIVAPDHSQVELASWASFEQPTGIDEALIQEYHERNKRKLEDEKWLKANKPTIVQVMEKLGRDKKDFGDYRVSVVTPDESRFDMAKVLEYLESNAVPVLVYNSCIKTVVNETALAEAIENGLIELEALKAAAWVEKIGTARLTVKQV